MNMLYTCPDCGRERTSPPGASKETCLQIPHLCADCFDTLVSKNSLPNGYYLAIEYSDEIGARLWTSRHMTREELLNGPDISPSEEKCIILPHIHRLDMPSRFYDGVFIDHESEAWVIRQDEWNHYIELNLLRAAKARADTLNPDNDPPFDFDKVSLAKLLYENIEPIGNYLVIEYDDNHGASLKEAARLTDVAKAIFFREAHGAVFRTADECVALPHLSRQDMPDRESDGCSSSSKNDVWVICKDDWNCFIQLNKLLAVEAGGGTSDPHSTTATSDTH